MDVKRIEILSPTALVICFVGGAGINDSRSGAGIAGSSETRPY
jgi:hypothetical protein